MRRYVMALLALLPPAGGCSYMADRGLDLAQVVDLSVGLSEGVDVNARATKLAQLGFGSYRGSYWMGLKDGLFDVWQEERSELGIGPLYVHEVFRSEGSRLLDIRYPLFGDAGFREYCLDLTHLSDRGLLDVGATLNVVFLGFDAAVKTSEILDFLCGLFVFDLLEDDVYSPSEAELSKRLGGESARVRAAAARALRFRFGERFGYAQYGAPEQMPGFQIQAVQQWRERLGTLGSPVTPEEQVNPDEAAVPDTSPEDR
ncbi:MAG: hypothetical protein V2A76_09495 [Planctomycetota bacterium]